MDEITINGLSITYNDSQDLVAIIEVFVLDIYKIGKLRKGDLVLDLGAGIGDFALAASRAVGDSGMIVAVEPNPIDFGILIRNIKANRCHNIFAFNNAFSSLSRSVINLRFKDQYFTATTISANEILQFIKQKGKNHVDVIKMDIEGAEVDAIHSLRDFLSYVRAIMIELHGTKKEVDTLLKPFGFKFKKLNRRDYLTSALLFSIKHPFSILKLWRIFYTTDKYPGIKKMLKGIEITTNENLVVGMYEKEC